MSIAAALKTEIDAYARELQSSNRLYLAAAKGQLSPDHVNVYVSGVLFQIRGATGVLHRAARRAAAVGNDPLAAHFRHKLVEEAGHDRWAERDLVALGSPGRSRGATALTSAQRHVALEQLIAFLEGVVEEDPALFLSYIFLSEYLTVLVGSAWLQALNEGCGIKTKVSVVSNHIELDRDHVAEGMREIDALVPASKSERMLEVVRESMRYYDEFWDEVLEAAPMAA